MGTSRNTVDTLTTDKIIHSYFLFPIRIGFDPMERLIVVSFKGNPFYTMLEPQVFNDPINGIGMRVLGYRKDEKVDVFWEKGVNVDRSTINIGAGIGDFEEVFFDRNKFKITEHGVELDVAFTDTNGRNVEMRIKENSDNIKRFPFLAPVGKDIEEPKRLFFAYMLEFDFVRKKGTEFFGRIGENILVPESFPITRDLRKVYFMRYSANPVVGFFNPEMTVPGSFEINNATKYLNDGMNIFLDGNGKISHLSAGDKKHEILMKFESGFPNLIDISDGNTETGRWKYFIAGDLITAGTYYLKRKGDKVLIDFDVKQNWIPNDLPCSFGIFTRIVSSFRKWPATYRWEGIVSLGEKPSLTGEWKRK